MNDARIPRYQRLKDMIVRRISASELRPGDRVPSEHQLVAATGVSRMTANRALRELTEEGYVERIAGIGTFVADLKAASHVLEVRNIADEVKHRGHRYAARVLRRDTVQPDERVARALRSNEPVLYVRLVHLESGMPIQLEERFVIPSFAPDFLDQDFTQVTPSAYLSSVSPLQEAEHVVRAEMPDASTSADLQMGEVDPCLVVIRRTWAHDGPVTFARLYHPGSRFELSGHYVPPGTQAMSSAAGHGDWDK